ncbi:OmpA family protein [Spirosoma koreense]
MLLSRWIGYALLFCLSLPVKAQPSDQVGTLPLSIHILYFDQSSDRLRPGVKIALDSVARQLVSQPRLMAIITGYTDVIGKRELNLALSERRARMVEHYLNQRGVSTDRMNVQWQGPDTNVSAEDSKAVKTIRRRVAILLVPR